MKIYFPDAKTNINYVGYNHAIQLLGKALKNYIVEDPKQADYRLYCNLPWHHNPKLLKTNGLPLIAYTMYEATIIPSNWVKFLNKHMEEVWVPSVWCKEIFEKNGVIKPIRVLSLGLEVEKVAYTPKSKLNDLYIYLWQGVAYDVGGRKGVEKATQAFRELRQEKRIGNNARLIIKYRPYKNMGTVFDKAEVSNGIFHIQRNMSKKELDSLYAEVDCCINPTHAEGFGLIPLEQMSRGKPVIVTNYSMPYIDKKVCIPLDYELKDSVVTWNHRHLRFGVNGFSINLGGMGGFFEWFPKLKCKVADGSTYMPLVAPGYPELKVSGLKKLKAHVNNLFSTIQLKIGFYNKENRRGYTLLQEYQGMDAHVKIDDLKNKMEWCYNNKEQAENIGLLASKYVNKDWSLSRIQKDFIKLLKDRGEK